jgi:hypothetical protein
MDDDVSIVQHEVCVARHGRAFVRHVRRKGRPCASIERLCRRVVTHGRAYVTQNGDKVWLDRLNDRPFSRTDGRRHLDVRGNILNVPPCNDNVHAHRWNATSVERIPLSGRPSKAHCHVWSGVAGTTRPGPRRAPAPPAGCSRSLLPRTWRIPRGWRPRPRS